MTNLKRAACTVLALAVLVCALPARAAAEDRAEAAYASAAAYLCRTAEAPQPGSVGGEWLVLGLRRGGYEMPEGYLEGYYEALTALVAEKGGVLHQRKYTEYSRVVLALTAMGKDPSDVGGYDLLLPLGDFDRTVQQGVSGPVWALIALDSGGYPVPKNPGASTQATRELYVEDILRRQLADGGFALSGSAADPDITAMALLALAKYQGREDAAAAAGKALDCLSVLQEADGGYSSWGDSCTESTAQVILTLCTLGVSLDDPRFVKNGNTLLDHLLSFQTADGGFTHVPGSDTADRMATEQALLALAAVDRAMAGRSGLFEMNDSVRTGYLPGGARGGGGTGCSLSFYYFKNMPVWRERP